MFRRGLKWEIDGKHWPNREASRFLTVRYPGAGRLHWHVQVLGRGRAVLLVHGTGAASHSFADLAPALAERFTVVVPDLPGHGFTDLPPLRGLTIRAMARGLRDLLDDLGAEPVLAAGHSAGAAILARMSLDGRLPDLRALIGLNGALRPYPGSGNWLFGTAMKAMFWNPVAPRLFAARAAGGMADKLLDATGSRIGGPGRALYKRLAADPSHCAGALGMMAGWELEPLYRDLPKLAVPLVQLTGSADRAIPPHHQREVQRHVPGTTLEAFDGLGHLAHEEDPPRHAAAILALAERVGLADERTAVNLA
jgi:magnesium chelatase accessory protein